MGDLAWPRGRGFSLAWRSRNAVTPIGAAAARPSTTNTRFAKLRMIRDQVAALWSIFAFFGGLSGKTVFCPAWRLPARPALLSHDLAWAWPSRWSLAASVLTTI